MSAEKIRIRLKAYDHKILDQSLQEIVETVKRTGAKIIGPIPLPTETKKYTVNRATFIDKNSREHFGLKTHKRLIDILNPTNQTIDSLMHLELPAGVEVEVKM